MKINKITILYVLILVCVLITLKSLKLNHNNNELKKEVLNQKSKKNKSLAYHKDMFLILLKNENTHLPISNLTNYRGERCSLKEILKQKKHGETIVVYYPKCICNIKKEKILFELDSLSRKNTLTDFIFVFEEIKYQKLLTLKRVYNFNCQLFCDPTFKLDIIGNKQNQIFLFKLDSTLTYKNITFINILPNYIKDVLNIY